MMKKTFLRRCFVQDILGAVKIRVRVIPVALSLKFLQGDRLSLELLAGESAVPLLATPEFTPRLALSPNG